MRVDRPARSTAEICTNRLRNWDFDIIVAAWAKSLTPGNEQREYWGSHASNTPGSRNLVGISNKAIDALIDHMVFAANRDELVAATRALDRVLLAVVDQTYRANAEAARPQAQMATPTLRSRRRYWTHFTGTDDEGSPFPSLLEEFFGLVADAFEVRVQEATVLQFD